MYDTIAYKNMPVMDVKKFIKLVACVFCLSSVTAFSMALLRVIKPENYYLETLEGSDKVVHYIVSGLIILTSVIGFLNSCVVLNRRSCDNVGRNVTAWLLLDSLFESCRVVYVFVCEVVLRSQGEMQLYELLASVAQYVVDSYLYCQVILKH